MLKLNLFFSILLASAFMGFKLNLIRISLKQLKIAKYRHFRISGLFLERVESRKISRWRQQLITLIPLIVWS